MTCRQSENILSISRIAGNHPSYLVPYFLVKGVHSALLYNF